MYENEFFFTYEMSTEMIKAAKLKGFGWIDKRFESLLL
jgi:hypothetical protein